jgi:hypothetical protein
MKSGIFAFALLTLVLVLGLAGCGGSKATETTEVSTPTFTTTTPTSSPTLTTPSVSPTPTFSPSPTKTATLSPTPYATTGTLTVYCNLMLGTVYLDDKDVGYPQGFYGLTLDNVTPGVHTVKVTSSGWGDWSKQVGIMPGQTTVLYAYLALGEANGAHTRYEIIGPDRAAEYGTLELHCSTMQANVYLNGEPGGPTSAVGATNVEGLLPGTYTLEIIESGWGTWSKQVSIQTGKTTVIYAYPALGEEHAAPTRNETIGPDSAALFGSLKIHCNVMQANIYIGGEPGGPTSPLGSNTIDGLLPGTYTVRITLSGWNDWTQTVTIQTGQTTEITATLVQSL